MGADDWLLDRIVKSSNKSSVVSDSEIGGVEGLVVSKARSVFDGRCGRCVDGRFDGRATEPYRTQAKQPFRVRVLLTEITHKHRVTNIKLSNLNMLLMRLLTLSNSLGQTGSHNI